ncbi:Gfo/Idh/MocA family oxidoreductase [soil metagenome]
MLRREFLATSLAASVAFAADPVAKRRVAVIGHTGRGDYGHGMDVVWLKLPDTEIVSVADADAKGLAAAKAKLNVEAGYADYKTMLAAVKPEIVAVCPRYIDEHHDMILAAVDAGAKAIYVEKAFCRTPAEADAIVTATTKRNVKLAVAHRNRWHPVLPVIAKLIQDDTIGRVLELRGRGKEDQRGGSLDLWVLGGHIINLAICFAGSPQTCSATVKLGGKSITKADIADGAEGVGPLAGDEVHARFDMKNGLPFFFDSMKGAGVAAAGFGLQIIGTKGIIDFRIDKEPLVHILPGSPFQPLKEAKAWTPISTTGVGQAEPIADIGKNLMDHVLGTRDLISTIGTDKAPLCDARDAALTVEMVAAVFESHRLGGQQVTLPLTNREHPLTRL